MEAIRDTHPEVFITFMAVWLCLALISFLFFHFNKNATLKRRIHPGYIIFVGVVFLGFLYLHIGRNQPRIFWFAIPAVTLISYLNIRRTRFCDSCGLTLYPRFSKDRFCPQCGNTLIG